MSAVSSAVVRERSFTSTASAEHECRPLGSSNHHGSPPGTTAAIEVVVHGSWSHSLGLEVSGALRHCFADRPAAVIVDLHGMTDDDALSLPLWLAARRAAAVLRPPVRLALCLPMTTLRERLRRIGAHRLPMYAAMIDARTAMANANKLEVEPSMPNHTRVIRIGRRPPG